MCNTTPPQNNSKNNNSSTSGTSKNASVTDASNDIPQTITSAPTSTSTPLVHKATSNISDVTTSLTTSSTNHNGSLTTIPSSTALTTSLTNGTTQHLVSSMTSSMTKKKKKKHLRPIKKLKRLRKKKDANGNSIIGDDESLATVQTTTTTYPSTPLASSSSRNYHPSSKIASLQNHIDTLSDSLKKDLSTLLSHKSHMTILNEDARALHSRTTQLLSTIDERSQTARRFHLQWELLLLSLEKDKLDLTECDRRATELATERDSWGGKVDDLERRMEDKRRAIEEAKERLSERDVFYDAWEECPGEGAALGEGWVSGEEGEEDDGGITDIIEEEPLLPCDSYMRISDLDHNLPSYDSSSGTLYSLDADTTPQIIDRLVSYALDTITDEGSRWEPTTATNKILSKRDSSPGDWQYAEGNDVFVWSTKFTHGGHGGDYPVVKARGNVATDPTSLMELLVDSSRCGEYNKMSLGRTDDYYFQKGYATIGGRFGDGESKIIRSKSKIPMIKKPMELLSLFVVRRVEKYKGYICVTRAVWENDDGTKSGGDTNRSEVLLGVNLLRLVEGGTEMTTVSHMYSPGVPLAIGKRIGLNSAASFIRDIQNIFE